MTYSDMSETLDQEYNNYLSSADDGNGNDIITGKPLKTFDEWVDYY
jgi:hypothetical protein